MDFNLYRIKVLRPFQSDLFDPKWDPASIVQQAVLERPAASSRSGFEWHIGNIEQIDAKSLYFRFGRQAVTQQSILNDETGDFADTEVETAPYTHVFLDVPHEVVAIAQKTSLASNTHVVARQLGKVLAQAAVARDARLTFTVSEIKEPEQFIEALRHAYAIRSFTVYFTRPNPFDVNEAFFRPMELLAQEAQAANGSTTIEGQSLDPEPLLDLTRSAAATGDDASAKIVAERGGRVVKRSLKKNIARLTQGEVSSMDDKEQLITRLRETYSRIREGRDGRGETT